MADIVPRNVGQESIQFDACRMLFFRWLFEAPGGKRQLRRKDGFY